VSGTIAARVVMGSLCDWVGPRLGMACALLLSAPSILGLALATKPIDFIMLRFGIGFGLSAFVACQFWTSCLFNVKIVGAPYASSLQLPAACLRCPRSSMIACRDFPETSLYNSPYS
jgi:MFS transporter, NNP family, nitrate/nitrite transporter